MPPAERSFLEHQTRLLCSSYSHWTGRQLIKAGTPETDAVQALWEAPFAVVAHDTFQRLMGDEVEPRRQFIEANAKFADNLDV